MEGGGPTASVGRVQADLPRRLCLSGDARVIRSAPHRCLHMGHRPCISYLPQLRWHLGNAGGRGVGGTAVIRRILEARREDKGICHSPLETIARRLFRTSSLPTPVKQYSVTDSGTVVGRVDFACPDIKIAIEVVGWGFHSGRRRWEKDLRRRTALESRGWMVLEFTWDEVMNQPDVVIETIRRALTGRSFPRYTRSASA
jgi:hypothetical protein